ncbi:MAG TPA: CoA-transferase [candidate division Zixibacteria bacterium]|nr:CoA-transferase [candidate division Zixibacteria bacterium]
MTTGADLGDKLMSMSEAIGAFSADGISVVMGTCMEQKIPFSAGHELIRQGRKVLTLIGPISDILFDQLIGAGCVRRVMAAWIGNVMMGSGYNFRRAFEQNIPHPIEVIDYSNFAIACALHAGALGLPFMPLRSLMGTDIAAANPNLVETTSPFDPADRLLAVRALQPDLGIFVAQRADAHGAAHIWGDLAVTADAARAAKKVIVVAEEIVDTAVIESDPNRTVIPGFLVDAVVHEPFAAHPSPTQGCYNRDHEFYVSYHNETRERSGFENWLQKWVLDVADRREYLGLLGANRVESLLVTRSQPAAATEFGY